MQTESVQILVVHEAELTEDQASTMLALEISCFADQVTEDELEEDFDRPCVARVLAYHGEELIACAEVFQREVIYAGRSVSLGGLSPCTREDWRGQGLASLVCRAAMDYLASLECDVVFLSVDTERPHHHLYERLGFVMLAQPFSYLNSRGEMRQSDGGMLAWLASPALFELMRAEQHPLFLGPELGYW